MADIADTQLIDTADTQSMMASSTYDVFQPLSGGNRSEETAESAQSKFAQERKQKQVREKRGGVGRGGEAWGEANYIH